LDHDPATSVSCVAGITGMHNHTWLSNILFYLAEETDKRKLKIIKITTKDK
jgi:hypothetical protein